MVRRKVRLVKEMAHEAQQLEKQRAVLQKMYDELEPLEANVSAVRSRLSSLVHAERLEILDFLSEPTVDAETQAQLDAAERASPMRDVSHEHRRRTRQRTPVPI